MPVGNGFVRVIRNSGAARFFIPAGLVLLVFGIILLSMNTRGYVETTGRIAEVTELPVDVTDEDRSVKYDVKVRYTVDGKDYETVFSGLGGNYRTGDDIKVFYDPADPARTTNARMDFLGPVLVGAGALSLVIGVFAALRAFRRSAV